jgi:hypothetical protein
MITPGATPSCATGSISVRAGLRVTGGGDCGGGVGVAAKALTEPGLRGGPVEVGTYAGHGVADSAARGRCRHGGKHDEPAHPAEADLRQIDDEVARSGVQRGEEGGADEGECEHVDVSGQVQHCNTSRWAGLDVEMVAPHGGGFGIMQRCPRPRPRCWLRNEGQLRFAR